MLSQHAAGACAGFPHRALWSCEGSTPLQRSGGDEAAPSPDPAAWQCQVATGRRKGQVERSSGDWTPHPAHGNAIAAGGPRAFLFLVPHRSRLSALTSLPVDNHLPRHPVAQVCRLRSLHSPATPAARAHPRGSTRERCLTVAGRPLLAPLTRSWPHSRSRRSQCVAAAHSAAASAMRRTVRRTLAPVQRLRSPARPSLTASARSSPSSLRPSCAPTPSRYRPTRRCRPSGAMSALHVRHRLPGTTRPGSRSAASTAWAHSAAALRAAPSRTPAARPIRWRATLRRRTTCSTTTQSWAAPSRRRTRRTSSPARPGSPPAARHTRAPTASTPPTRACPAAATRPRRTRRS